MTKKENLWDKLDLGERWRIEFFDGVVWTRHNFVYEEFSDVVDVATRMIRSNPQFFLDSYRIHNYDTDEIVPFAALCL